MGELKEKKKSRKLPPEKQFLSRQQHDIIVLVRAGLKNKDIATAMGLSIKTTSTHLMRIYEKFGLDSSKNVYYLITKLEEMDKLL